VAIAADRPLSLRATALASLVRVAPDAAIPVVEEWSGSENWLARFYAARALAGAPWPSSAAHLEPLIRDGDARVVTEALTSAAAASSDSAAAAYRWFLEGLAAPDVMVRAAAARGIARAPRTMDLPVLLQAYERASSDSVTDAAVAIVEALGALAAADVPVDRSFFVRCTRAPDAVERRAGAAHIGDAGRSGAPAEQHRSAAARER